MGGDAVMGMGVDVGAVGGVDDIAVGAVGGGGAVGVVGLAAVSGVAAVMDQVDEDAGDDGEDEEAGEDCEGLVGDHGEHDEGFISGRGDHHGDEGAEGEESVGVEGDGRETAHAAGDRAEEGRDDDLAEFGLAEAAEEHAAGFYVEGFDHHHHDGHEAGDEDGVAEDVDKEVEHVLCWFWSRPKIRAC